RFRQLPGLIGETRQTIEKCALSFGSERPCRPEGEHKHRHYEAHPVARRIETVARHRLSDGNTVHRADGSSTFRAPATPVDGPSAPRAANPRLKSSPGPM